MVLRFKPGVVVDILDTRLFPGLLALCNIMEEVLGPLGRIWITSVNEGRHKSGSFHFVGRAVDIRCKFYRREDVSEIVNRFRSSSGEYMLLWENPGEPNEHLHFQFDQGK